MKPIFFKFRNWLRLFLTGTFFDRRSAWQAFPAFFEAAGETSFPIPGLEQVSSLNLSQQVERCSAMTPQGMTLTEKYLLISAYCHDHQHHSVTYVLDRNSGRKIKTVILPDLPHAGGLAYDPRQQKIWLSNSSGKHAAVAALSLAEIEAYSEAGPPITYQQKVGLKELPRASALTYDHGYLVVASFVLRGFGQIICYPLDPTGNLFNPSNGSLIQSPYGSLKLPTKIQGVTFYQNYLLLAQSWGNQPGKIIIFDIHATSDFSDLTQASQILTTPPYLEQIYVAEEQLLVLFESGATAYRKKTPHVMKEVLQLDLNKLLKP